MPILTDFVLPHHSPNFQAYPLRWVKVTPHATEYLEDVAHWQGVKHNTAIGIYTSDGGVVRYRDPWSDVADETKEITLAAGSDLSGYFVRILPHAGSPANIWVAFNNPPPVPA